MTSAGPSAAIDLGAVEPNDLVRHALAGSPDAFSELSRRFRPRLLHLLQRRFDGQIADAEDVTQEAFARAFQHLHRFDPQYRFSTWLYTIALRLAYDHRRDLHRDAQRTRPLDSDPPSHRSSTAEEALKREESDNLWGLARSLLSSPQYTALWLRYGEDLPLKDVAQAMDKTQVGVRVLLHRARVLLIAHHSVMNSVDANASPSRSPKRNLIL